MTLRKYLVALLVTGASLAFVGTASAAFPNYSGCPVEQVEACVNVQGVRGSLRIKDYTVPLGDSLEIRGGLVGDEARFVPPRGTTGLFARPVSVPGGLLGIEWIPGTSVLAITELAGPPSAIRFDLETLTVALPIKVRLENLFIGMNCHIGTNSRPVNLRLIVGTTSPPPPNRPISGSIGSPRAGGPGEILVNNAVNVENSFAVPGASSCGLGLGLINSLVNLRLGLPSAGGNNEIQVTNNIGIQFLPH